MGMAYRLNTDHVLIAMAVIAIAVAVIAMAFLTVFSWVVR
jgi:hypothetical protein